MGGGSAGKKNKKIDGFKFLGVVEPPSRATGVIRPPPIAKPYKKILGFVHGVAEPSKFFLGFAHGVAEPSKIVFGFAQGAVELPS
jgi:hypothetical protein